MLLVRPLSELEVIVPSRTDQTAGSPRQPFNVLPSNSAVKPGGTAALLLGAPFLRARRGGYDRGGRCEGQREQRSTLQLFRYGHRLSLFLVARTHPPGRSRGASIRQGPRPAGLPWSDPCRCGSAPVLRSGWR